MSSLWVWNGIGGRKNGRVNFHAVLELVRCIKYAPMLANFGTGKKPQILPKSRRILQVMEIGCVVVCCLHCYIPRLKKREHYKGNSQKFELPENASKEAQSQTVFMTLGSLAKRNSQTSTRKAQTWSICPKFQNHITAYSSDCLSFCIRGMVSWWQQRWKHERGADAMRCLLLARWTQ